MFALHKIKYILLNLILFLNVLSANTYNFTQDEKDWLSNNPMVKIAVMDYWNHDGYGNTIHTDYLKLLNRCSDINIVPIRYSVWKDGYNQVIDKDEKNIYGIMNLSWSKEREEKYFLYTKAYNFEPNYLITRKSNNDITNLQELKTKTVLVKEKSITRNIVKEISDHINIIQIKSDLDMYKRLFEDKNIDAFITYNVNKELLKKYNLKVVKIIYDKFSEVSIGINKKYPQLQSIINKIYKTIPKDELFNLRNKVYNNTKPYKSKSTLQENKILNLTTEEKKFIKNNILKVGVEQWKPAIYSNDGTDIDGVTGDFLKEIIKLTGLKVKIVNDKWSNIISGLENKTIDIIPATYYTKKREKFGLYGESFFKIKDFIYMRKDDYSIHSLKDLEDKVLAITKGNGRIDDIKQRFPKIKFAFTKDYNEAIDLLLNNQVDAIYDSQLTMDNMIRENMIVGIKGIAQRTFKTPSLHFFSRIDKPILQSILQKGLKAIPKQKRDEIKNRWLGLSEIEQDKFILNLSLKQKKYLQKKKVIKMCNNPGWEPIEFAQNGNLNNIQGISIDTIKLIEKKLNIRFESVPTKSWSESQQFLKDKKCDILSSAVKTIKREKYANFTKPYLKLPLAILTTKDKNIVSGLDDIMDKSWTRHKGSGLITNLKKEYPNMNLIETKNIKESLQQVDSGKAYFTIATLPVASHVISKYMLNNLHIAGYSGRVYNVSIAVRNDDKVLLNILDKTLDNISKNESKQIMKKWVNSPVKETVIDYSLIWKILGVVFIIGIFVLYRQYLLNDLNIKLESSLNEFEYLFNNTIETIALFQDNICIDINEAGLKLLKYDNKQQIIGKHALDFILPNDREIAKQKLATKTVEPYEIRILKKDATSFPSLLKGYNTTIKGVVTRVTSVIDLTQLKQKEQESIRLKEKAEESTKAKSQFLANMSHEIRTPIHGILGMSHLVLQTDLNNKQKDFIEKIDINIRYLLSIINDILDFSKIEAGKLTLEKVNFNLVKTIENITELLRFKAKEKNLKLIVDYDNNLNDFFYGDNLRISQIIINLLGNAIKFTHSGEVKIHVEKLNNDKVKFEVSDTGIGLTNEHQEKLFDSFVQADGTITRNYGGTGLGLSISKQLVELMNGKIWVESQIDVGSKFIFEIELLEVKNIDNLNLVNDKKEYITKEDFVNKIDTREKIDVEKRIKLFLELKEALISKRPKQYKPIIKEIQRYKLDIDEKLFNKVENLVKEYKLEEAINLMENIN